MNLKKHGTKAALLLLAAAVIAAVFIIGDMLRKSSDYTYRKNFFAMDTIVDVRSGDDIADDIKSIFEEYDTALSCRDHDDSSKETAYLNCYGGKEVSDILSGTLMETFSLNEKYGTLTDVTIGRLTRLWDVTAENPTVPDEETIASAMKTVGIENVSIEGNYVALKNNTELDFGAVGKGAVLDGCFAYLKENNRKKTIISTGSSLLLYGDGFFDVDINDPDGDGTLATVKTDYSFLSTSGGYERYFEANGKTYCHIIDPRTGYPTETDLTTVTVFCNSGIESDFLSTMIFLDGSDNIGKYLDSPDYKIFAADKNNRIYVSGGLEYEVCNEKYSE